MKASAVPGAAGRQVLSVAARELAALAERHDGSALQAAAELIEAAEQAEVDGFRWLGSRSSRRNGTALPIA